MTCPGVPCTLPVSYTHLDVYKRQGWDNVVAITCTRSGIAALGADGTVRLAGNLRGLRSLSAAWNASAEAIYRQLLHGAQQVPVW